ncbi:hypothetical protein BC833DRAFT_601266 [Globomyces pollinis-pini]|nr:hypothetical protein BC833DRAFT_601266 [Globomyces pollinis-pini]
MVNFKDSQLHSFPTARVDQLPMDILHQIADWSVPKDLTQLTMASKFFLPLRNELFAKRKVLKTKDRSDLDEVSDFIKDNVQFISVKKHNFNLNSLNIFKNLRHLKREIVWDQTAVISPLESLVSLEKLDLYWNCIVHVPPLVSLVKLKELCLAQNYITDISPLASIISLTKLNLDINRIADINALTSLINLKRLGLRVNQIRDISPLASLVNLKELDLAENRIIDISPLALY